MSTRTRLLLALAVLASAGTAIPAALHAQGVEGTDYRKVKPRQPTDSPGKIEVIECFSYPCPHCNEFYPLASIWQATLPKNVVFPRVPVGFNRAAWINLARAYYALQASGGLDTRSGALAQLARIVHAIAAGEVNHPDRARVRGGDGVLHFHRLDLHQRLPGGAFLSHGDRHRHHHARQGRGERAAGGARRKLARPRVLQQQLVLLIGGPQIHPRAAPAVTRLPAPRLDACRDDCAAAQRIGEGPARARLHRHGGGPPPPPH